MKNNLPRKLRGFTTFIRTKQGFTLVELLVVITILAILGMIALSVFSNAQKQARDAKRKSDIDAIAKSLEASRDFSTAAGLYFNKLGSDFPGGAPSDSGVPKYCVSTDTTAFSEIASPTFANWIATSACPTSPTGWNNQVSDSVPSTSTGFKSWKVCARLEAKDVLHCKGSAAR